MGKKKRAFWSWQKKERTFWSNQKKRESILTKKKWTSIASQRDFVVKRKPSAAAEEEPIKDGTAAPAVLRDCASGPQPPSVFLFFSFSLCRWFVSFRAKLCGLLQPPSSSACAAVAVELSWVFLLVWLEVRHLAWGWVVILPRLECGDVFFQFRGSSCSC